MATDAEPTTVNDYLVPLHQAIKSPEPPSSSTATEEDILEIVEERKVKNRNRRLDTQLQVKWADEELPEWILAS